MDVIALNVQTVCIRRAVPQLCRSKNNVVAEWALRGYSSPIGVAEWTTAITTALPEDLASSLPSIEEIEAELSDPRLGDAD